MCRKTEKLTTVSSKAILECFLTKKAIIIRGSTVCKSHLTKKNLLKDDILGPPYDYAEMTGDQITTFLSVLHKEVNEKLNKKKGLNHPI